MSVQYSTAKIIVTLHNLALILIRIIIFLIIPIIYTVLRRLRKLLHFDLLRIHSLIIFRIRLFIGIKIINTGVIENKLLIFPLKLSSIHRYVLLPYHSARNIAPSSHYRSIVHTPVLHARGPRLPELDSIGPISVFICLISYHCLLF